MTKKVLVLGNSGTGKSRAALNLDPTSTFLISPDMKKLPVKGIDSKYKTVLSENGKIDLEKTNYYKTRDSKVILQLIKAISEKKLETKVIIIDTITQLMFSEYMRTIKDKGYDKFNDIADNIWKLLSEIDDLRDDLTVIIIGHLDNNYDDIGTLRASAKVPAGKILKDKTTVEELFDIVLYTDVIMDNDKPTYWFVTQNNGRNTCKSPEGMFNDIRIENDYKMVIDKINEYYN